MTAEADFTRALASSLHETFAAGARAALEALAEGFEDIARGDLDGDHGTVTYRDLIDVIRRSSERVKP